MKIIYTFVSGLTSFKFHSKDELERNLDLWTDIKYLYDFFEKNKNDLSFYKIKTAKDAVELTLREVNRIRKKLYQLSLNTNNNLDELFHNLNDNEYKETLLSKQKSKHHWLRLYAIKIESNHYVITGGAIKLIHKMKGSELTKKEKDIIENCRNYLLEKEVYNADTFYELII